MFEDLNPLDKSTAMVEIVIMVAGAALLGFLVGWLVRKLKQDKLEAEVRFLQDKHDSLMNKAESSIKDHIDLQRQVEDLRQRKDALVGEVDTKTKEIDVLNGKLKEAQEAGAGPDASKAIAGLKQQVESLESEKEALVKEVADWRTKLEQTDRQSGEIAPLKDLIETLEKDKRELAARIEELGSDSSKLEEIERLKGAVAMANEERDQLRDKLNTLNDSLPDPGELSRLQARLDSMDTENATLKERLASVTSDEELKNKVTRLTEEVNQLMRENRELHEEKAELEEQLDEPVQNTVDPKQIADLKRTITALESEKETLQNALKKRMTETVGPEQISNLEKKMEDLKRGLEPVIKPEAETVSKPMNGSTETPADKSAEAGEEPQKPAETAEKEEKKKKKDGVSVDRPDTSLTYEDYQARKKALLQSVGKATESGKDPLSEIVGVGPFIEAKLNSIGIFTYDQISRFSDEDIDNVTRLIEFFPGRIERDGWVRQAVKLIKKKEEV